MTVRSEGTRPPSPRIPSTLLRTQRIQHDVATNRFSSVCTGHLHDFTKTTIFAVCEIQEHHFTFVHGGLARSILHSKAKELQTLSELMAPQFQYTVFALYTFQNTEEIYNAVGITFTVCGVQETMFFFDQPHGQHIIRMFTVKTQHATLV